jgi:hypothetical protein
MKAILFYLYSALRNPIKESVKLKLSTSFTHKKRTKGKQEFRRRDFGSRLLAAEVEGGGGL